MGDLWFPILQCIIPIKCHGKVFWGIVVSHAGTELRLQYASPPWPHPSVVGLGSLGL